MEKEPCLMRGTLFENPLCRMNRIAMKNTITFLVFTLCFLVTTMLQAQDTVKTVKVIMKGGKPISNKPVGYEKTVIDGDTLLLFRMQEVKILEQRVFKTRKEEKKYWRMVRNVKKALPYAKIAKEKLDKYEAQLDGKQKRERKLIMKQVEQELLAEYADELKGLTITQGRILLKLIDRETGHTSYELVESLRGWFSANFWQGIAVLFDADLKSDFNPKTSADDAMIDEIVVRIENGEL
jgi:hypothetical protein